MICSRIFVTRQRIMLIFLCVYYLDQRRLLFRPAYVKETTKGAKQIRVYVRL